MKSEQYSLKPLSELCEFRRGLTYKKGDQVEFSSTPVLRATNISLDSNALILDDLRYISDEFVVPQNKMVIPESILMCISSGSKKHLGKVAFIEDIEPLAFGGFMALLVPKSEIYPKYLYYSLISPMFRDWIAKLSDGTNINNLNFSKIENFQICLPPFDQQKRIVSILDEEFENIEENKNKVIRKKKGAAELLRALLRPLMMSDQWPLVTLGEIALIKGGKRLPKGHTYAEAKTQHPYISVKDFTDDGTIDPTNLKYIDEETFNHISRYTISSNNLYLSIAGTIGKTGIVPEQLDGANLTENACKLIFNEGVDKNFVYYFTKSESFIEQAGLFTKATGQPKLALTRLKKIVMPLPTLEEQRHIVIILDKASKNIIRIEDSYLQELASYDELKQSILQEAFNGHLTKEITT
jgi:type I restriction enzyme, S subunit